MLSRRLVFGDIRRNPNSEANSKMWPSFITATQTHQSINQTRLFNVAKVTGVIIKSTKPKSIWYVDSYSKMSGNDWWNE